MLSSTAHRTRQRPRATKAWSTSTITCGPPCCWVAGVSTRGRHTDALGTEPMYAEIRATAQSRLGVPPDAVEASCEQADRALVSGGRARTRSIAPRARRRAAGRPPSEGHASSQVSRFASCCRRKVYAGPLTSADGLEVAVEEAFAGDLAWWPAPWARKIKPPEPQSPRSRPQGSDHPPSARNGNTAARGK